jgi:hypothetical protein
MPLCRGTVAVTGDVDPAALQKSWGILVRTFWPETATKSAPAQKLEDSVVNEFATCGFPDSEALY